MTYCALLQEQFKDWCSVAPQCQKTRQLGHCCEEKTPCGDIAWVAGRTGKLPRIITSEINLMCGIQSVVIGMAAALERSSKCYLLIHGMRTDTQPQRIDCAINSLCAVLTQWKGEMRFKVVKHVSPLLSDSHEIVQMHFRWERMETLGDIIKYRERVQLTLINKLKYSIQIVWFLECYFQMRYPPPSKFPVLHLDGWNMHFSIWGTGGALWVDMEQVTPKASLANLTEQPCFFWTLLFWGSEYFWISYALSHTRKYMQIIIMTIIKRLRIISHKVVQRGKVPLETQYSHSIPAGNYSTTLVEDNNNNTVYPFRK